MRTVLALIALAASVVAAPAAANAPRADEGAERAVASGAMAAPRAGAAYGPFRVIDAGRAALVDATDGASPRAFVEMLRDHPGIEIIEFVECPGTDDDAANLALGRMIRARGIATHVPEMGSVRSGAVELFLAGARRTIDEGAEFAVHAWRDSEGREPGDYPSDSPYNRAYVEYYAEMGLSRPQEFYDMTNAVPNDAARWLTAQDMRAWLGNGDEGDVTIAYARSSQGSVLRSGPYLDLSTRIP